MKVVFLDIDGVLNTIYTFVDRYIESKQIGRRFLEIDESRLDILKQIIEETDAKIVLISSWRIFFKKENNSVVAGEEKANELLKLFNKFGLDIYDLTSYNTSGIREEEIKSWLDNNCVNDFVIIDDDINYLVNYSNDHLIKTKFNGKNPDEVGLCYEHISMAISILNLSESNVMLQKKLN